MSFSELYVKGYVLVLLDEAGKMPPWQMYLTLGLGILIAGFLIPYLLGSINSAVVLSRLLFHDDIRNHGSGNAGTTNMLRTYGKGTALLTLLGDVVKTVLAVLCGSLLMGAYLGGWVAALFCMIGHIFPVYYHFRGGKGVLCGATAVAMLAPMPFLCVFLTFLILVSMTKYVSLGSIVGGLMLPLFVDMFNNINTTGGINGLISVMIALLILWCHRENIKRIQNRTEPKLSFRKKDGPDKGEGKK